MRAFEARIRSLSSVLVAILKHSIDCLSYTIISRKKEKKKKRIVLYVHNRHLRRIMRLNKWSLQSVFPLFTWGLQSNINLLTKLFFYSYYNLRKYTYNNKIKVNIFRPFIILMGNKVQINVKKKTIWLHLAVLRYVDSWQLTCFFGNTYSH